MKALSKEVRGFSGRTKLPVYAASSIMVRYDTGERATAKPVSSLLLCFVVYTSPQALLTTQAPATAPRT